MLEHLEVEYGAIAIKASDALSFILNITPENHKRNNRELAAAMESLGYIRKNFSNKKLKGWHYVKPDAVEPALVIRDAVIGAKDALSRGLNPVPLRPLSAKRGAFL